MQNLGKLGEGFFRAGLPESDRQVERNDNIEHKPSIALLRLKFATNHFKRMMLGDLHVPGKAQTSTVFEALTGKAGENALTDRTWQSWFSNSPRVPKQEKIKTLDTLAASMNRGRPEEVLPVNIYSEMVHGGLTHYLLAPSKSKHPLDTLLARANNYQPLSPLHLHMDALEIDALIDGFGEDVPWTAVKAIGAQRILELLAERWGPRHGSVYSGFSSNLSLRWEAATPEERSKLREFYARFKPDLFEYFLNAKASPNWSQIGVDADVSPLHIYKVLFALAADAEFLVADRLVTWALDLATAALAMHALAWADRYTTFGLHITDELIFWAAFDGLLFNSEPLEPDNRELVAAMTRCSAEWNLAAVETFLRARETYHSELSELGVSVNEVFAVAMQATKVHCLVYTG